MKFGPDGRLYAINPEAGFFGVAPGTNSHTNPNAMLTLDGNAIFTNTALTDDGDVWWEGMTDEPPAHLTSWKGEDWTPDVGHARPPTPTPASPSPPPRTRPSPPSGRTRPACPSTPSCSAAAGPRWSRWSSRRSTGTTACSSARSWPRRPPRPRPARWATCGVTPSPCCPFCGYNMADYFAHWLDIGADGRPGQAAQDLLRQLVPQGRGRPLAVARLRRELPGARVGVRAVQRRRRGRRDPHRLRARPRAPSTPTGSTCRTADMEKLLTVDADEWRAEVPAHP